MCVQLFPKCLDARDRVLVPATQALLARIAVHATVVEERLDLKGQAPALDRNVVAHPSLALGVGHENLYDLIGRGLVAQHLEEAVDDRTLGLAPQALGEVAEVAVHLAPQVVGISILGHGVDPKGLRDPPGHVAQLDR